MTKEKIKNLYLKIKNWYEKYERWLLPGALLFGIVVDYIAFANINIITAFAFLGVHILFSGMAIIFSNSYEVGKFKKENRILGFIRLLSPLIIQFSFGALLSASLIFYIFSGSIYVSWPLILLIIILMVSNDVFRKYYLRARVQIAVYFFLLFCIVSIILPFVLQRFGILIFLLSGVISLTLIFIYIVLLGFYIDKSRFNIKRFVAPIAIIFIFINALYFLNIIPPIPFSLKDSVIGHSISMVNGSYTILIEGESFWEKIIPGQVIHKKLGESIIVYTAVFAPDNLKTPIFHNWQYKKNGKWVSTGRFSYSIAGGRKTGYRGYSIKTDVPAGEWRVDVETERGQVLGRIGFDILEVSDILQLFEVIK